MSTKNPVRWFEIYVADMARAKKFYGSVFGVELTDMSGGEMDMWGFPSDPNGWGCSGTLVREKNMKPGGTSTIVYFGSDDCAVEEKKITQFGGKIDRPKMSIGKYGFVTLGVDTEGNTFGVHSMK